MKRLLNTIFVIQNYNLISGVFNIQFTWKIKNDNYEYEFFLWN